MISLAKNSKNNLPSFKQSIQSLLKVPKVCFTPNQRAINSLGPSKKFILTKNILLNLYINTKIKKNYNNIYLLNTPPHDYFSKYTNLFLSNSLTSGSNFYDLKLLLTNPSPLLNLSYKHLSNFFIPTSNLTKKNLHMSGDAPKDFRIIPPKHTFYQNLKYTFEQKSVYKYVNSVSPGLKLVFLSTWKSFFKFKQGQLIFTKTFTNLKSKTSFKLKHLFFKKYKFLLKNKSYETKNLKNTDCFNYIYIHPISNQSTPPKYFNTSDLDIIESLNIFKILNTKYYSVDKFSKLILKNTSNVKLYSKITTFYNGSNLPLNLLHSSTQKYHVHTFFNTKPSF
jgi:hypothetical protein